MEIALSPSSVTGGRAALRMLEVSLHGWQRFGHREARRFEMAASRLYRQLPFRIAVSLAVVVVAFVIVSAVRRRGH
jgi:hypothetical protein